MLKRRGQLTYGAGDPNSTSGTAVPGYYLWPANKIEPKTFFKAVRVSNHETNLLSVINKQVDVAVNNTEALERYRLNTGKDANDSVRILWKLSLIHIFSSDEPSTTSRSPVRSAWLSRDRLRVWSSRVLPRLWI